MKRAIPKPPRNGEDRTRFDDALKENMEILMGQRGVRLEKLSDTATTAEIISKLNEIIDRLQ